MELMIKKYNLGVGDNFSGSSNSLLPGKTVGADLYAVYSGGTTDFSTGSVSITVTIERVA